MIKEKDMKNRIRTAFARLLSVFLLMMVTVMLASPGFAYAAEETAPEEPIREVHNVGVGSDTYCFFVTHNVVLTPAEVAAMSDEELTAAILDRAGLFMKKANCKVPAHKTITVKDWKKHGSFLLSTTDIEAMRAAQPVDGSPVKFYMDLLLSPDSGDEKGDGEADEEGSGSADEEKPLYSTYKKTSPRLLFAVVATEEDAKYGEDICIEDNNGNNQKIPRVKTESSDEDMLPEYRTISMVDRSGAPIAETLEDGDPVTLEWIEPKDIGSGEESFFDRFPGGIAGFASMTAAAAAAAVMIVLAVKRKNKEE